MSLRPSKDLSTKEILPTQDSMPVNGCSSKKKNGLCTSLTIGGINTGAHLWAET